MPDIHFHYHWDPESVCARSEATFARFTNLHSGCYVLTREQLNRAIASGGFIVQPHEGLYEPLETAATDPYTQCGFRKLICISDIGDFIVPHLSNKYAGKGSLPELDFHTQLKALCSLNANGKSKASLFPVETNLLHQRWSKSFYEPCQKELIGLIPRHVKKIISIGCGWGATEQCLIEHGADLKAVPIDPVIAASAEVRGVEIVYGDLKSVREQLATERFDCVLLSNVLHLVGDPMAFLNSVSHILSPDGWVIASVPNVSKLRRLVRSIIDSRGHAQNPKSYAAHGMHVTTGRVVRRWFRQAGLRGRGRWSPGSRMSLLLGRQIIRFGGN